jgi:RNA polymerase sigma-70 factor (ECF subfamily)
VNLSEESGDRPLVSAFLAARDERAFRSLYARHTPALYRFALRLCGGGVSDAEEVVQDTWVSAAGALDRFRWESTLRTWLNGIALNCYRQQVRSRMRITEELGDLAAPETELPAVDRVDLERALGGLAERYRMVVVLHDIEGYTHEEIGRMLGIDAGTSKSQLFRGRRRMRELLTTPMLRNESGNA